MTETRIKVKLDEPGKRCPLNRMDHCEYWQCSITETTCGEELDLECNGAPDDCPLRQGPVIVEAAKAEKVGK